MTKKYTMSMYASKEDLEADKLKAAADWLSENKAKVGIYTDQSCYVFIPNSEGFDGDEYCGKDLLEAVQNAISYERLNEIAAIGQEIDNNGECK